MHKLQKRGSPARRLPRGHKHDTGKTRLELLPFDALEEVGKALTGGAAAHGDRNWELGMKYGRVFGAGQRHQFAWFMRQAERDPDTGLHPLAHAIAELLFLLSYELRGMRKFDDRPHTTGKVRLHTPEKVRLRTPEKVRLRTPQRGLKA